MRVVVLFLCLCFLLPKGNAFIYAATQQRNISEAVVQRTGHHTASPDGCAVIARLHPETELSSLIGDDLEDEDNNEAPVTVLNLPAKWQPAGTSLSFVFILKHPSNSFKPTPPLIGQAPDLCLLQGVFRI